MLAVFNKKTCKLRRKDYVVRNGIKFLVAVHHLVRFAAMDVHAFKIKPLFLFRGRWANQKYFFVRLSIKCIAKQWVDRERQRKHTVDEMPDSFC